MDFNEAKEYVLEELNQTDPEQLEYLCEAVIQKVEKPESLEVTPFRHDKGIDIRGKTGDVIYDGNFGVQVKQTNSSVGAPVVQQFAGALDVDGANFGTFITTSDFTKPARRDVRETDEISIRLISGPRLAEIMVNNQMGVISQSEEEQTFAKEYDFWSQFTADEDLIPSSMVPQADDLEVLHLAVLGINKGHQFKPELADWLTEQTGDDWSRRQADYYAIAAHALGLLDNESGEYEVRGTPREVRKWALTEKGHEYVSKSKQDRDKADEFLYRLIEELEIIQLVTERVNEEIAIFQSELVDIIKENTAVSGSTAKRRATTVGKWISQTDSKIKRMDNGDNIKYASQATFGEDFN
jgi:restriction system protein